MAADHVSENALLKADDGQMNFLKFLAKLRETNHKDTAMQASLEKTNLSIL